LKKNQKRNLFQVIKQTLLNQVLLLDLVLVIQVIIVPLHKKHLQERNLNLGLIRMHQNLGKFLVTLEIISQEEKKVNSDEHENDEDTRITTKRILASREQEK
jgi:hypothetical protein